MNASQKVNNPTTCHEDISDRASREIARSEDHAGEKYTEGGSSFSNLTPEQQSRIEFNKSLAILRQNLKICSERVGKFVTDRSSSLLQIETCSVITLAQPSNFKIKKQTDKWKKSTEDQKEDKEERIFQFNNLS
ncbi:hypothetical protein LguiA_029495 [Lonicera macranthoides]